MVIIEILIILKIPPWDFHVAVVKSINNVVESKVNKGITGIDTIKKMKKRELDTF